MADHGTISFENSKRMRERRLKVDGLVEQAACERQALVGAQHNLINEIVKQERSHLNKQVYDLAERQGVSVYDICLQYMPEYGEPKFDLGGTDVSMTQGVRLVPMPLELEKGGGYWKDKYYRLKEHLQELIDNKED